MRYRAAPAEKPANNYMQLWQAVVRQAMMDATAEITPASTGTTIYNRYIARAWLLDKSEAFNDVCDMAGLHPGAIRMAAERMIANRASGIPGKPA